ncbi:unnamed protein product [Arctogadus glacialis]
MEKGSLAKFQGKSLEEIDIEEELELDEGEAEIGGVADTDEDEDSVPDEDCVADEAEDKDEDDDVDNEGSDPNLGLRGKRKHLTKDEANISKGKKKKMTLIQEEAKSSKGKTNRLETKGEVTSSKEVNRRRSVKRPWSKKEVSAAMKHFKSHITKGSLATMLECEQSDRALRKDLSQVTGNTRTRLRGLRELWAETRTIALLDQEEEKPLGRPSGLNPVPGQTAPDRGQTAQDQDQTAPDRVQTAPDRVQTAPDRVQTAPDRVQTDQKEKPLGRPSGLNPLGDIKTATQQAEGKGLRPWMHVL